MNQLDHFLFFLMIFTLLKLALKREKVKQTKWFIYAMKTCFCNAFLTCEGFSIRLLEGYVARDLNSCCFTFVGMFFKLNCPFIGAPPPSSNFISTFNRCSWCTAKEQNAFDIWEFCMLRMNILTSMFSSSEEFSIKFLQLFHLEAKRPSSIKRLRKLMLKTSKVF